MESVFYNDLIMECVGSYLPAKDIMACREQCRRLNDIMTPILARRNIVFTICTLPLSYSEVAIIPSMELDPRLAKRVRFQPGLLRNISPLPERRTSINNFFMKYHEIITDLDIHASSIFASDLAEMLQTFQFPVLTGISLLEEAEGGGRGGNLEAIGFVALRYFANLKCIKFGRNREIEGNDQCKRPFLPILTRWIMHAPNLEEFWIKDNYLPGFGSFKRLGITVSSHKYDGIPQIDEMLDMSRVNGMLDWGKNSLEELTLDNQLIGWNISQVPRDRLRYPLSNTFVLPVLPELKILRILAIDVFDVSTFLSPTQLPKLESITLKAFFAEDNLVSLIDSIPTICPITSVRNLTLVGTSNLSTIEMVKLMFPNVKNFTLHTKSSPIGRMPYPTENADLGSLFASFSNPWSLEMLQVIVANRCSIARLVIALISLSLQGLKKLKIRYEPAGSHDVDDSDINRITADVRVQQALLRMKQLDQFKCDIVGVQMSNPQARAVKDFIDEYNLPIYLGQNVN